MMCLDSGNQVASALELCGRRPFLATRLPRRGDFVEDNRLVNERERKLGSKEGRAPQ